MSPATLGVAKGPPVALKYILAIWRRLAGTPIFEKYRQVLQNVDQSSKSLTCTRPHYQKRISRLFASAPRYPRQRPSRRRCDFHGNKDARDIASSLGTTLNMISTCASGLISPQPAVISTCENSTRLALSAGSTYPDCSTHHSDPWSTKRYGVVYVSPCHRTERVRSTARPWARLSLNQSANVRQRPSSPGKTNPYST